MKKMDREDGQPPLWARSLLRISFAGRTDILPFIRRRRLCLLAATDRYATSCLLRQSDRVVPIESTEFKTLRDDPHFRSADDERGRGEIPDKARKTNGGRMSAEARHSHLATTMPSGERCVSASPVVLATAPCLGELDGKRGSWLLPKASPDHGRCPVPPEQT